jgi:nucleoid-associated protein YgaU
MGLRYHFDEQAGREIFGNSRGGDLASEEIVSGLERLLRDLGLGVEGLELEADGGRVIVRGRVPSLEQREKVVLALGNVRGVAMVDDELLVEGGAAPFAGQSDFYTVQPGDTWDSIARRSYHPDPQREDLLLAANRPILERPEHLRPGFVLRIPR